MPENNVKSGEALVVINVQRITVAYIGNGHAILNRLAQAINTARKVEMLVIYVKGGFREGYPEISPHNHLFSAALSSGSFTPAVLQLHPAIVP